MTQTYNVYCDESAHLEHDGQQVMVLGAVWCPLEKTRQIAERLREIKQRHGLPPDFEVKWSKVSPAKTAFYLDLVDYFFSDADLHFRALVIPDKSKLRHAAFAQDHDTWYYKMYFLLLSVLINPTDRYRIYLDIKDTRGSSKVERLHEVLCKSVYDFDRRVIEHVQTVRSDEVEQVQLADLLIGIVGYANRLQTSSSAKAALVKRARERSGYQLTLTTLLREQKFNLFRWHAQDATE